MGRAWGFAWRGGPPHTRILNGCQSSGFAGSSARSIYRDGSSLRLGLGLATAWLVQAWPGLEFVGSTHHYWDANGTCDGHVIKCVTGENVLWCDKTEDLCQNLLTTIHGKHFQKYGISEIVKQLWIKTNVLDTTEFIQCY